jgi:murein DD-endopeptidase MepM/ murein hydrolase activator NlpD
MRQAQKKKEKDKVAIALMLAFCVIALTSIFILKANIDKVTNNGDLLVSENTSTSQEGDKFDTELKQEDTSAQETSSDIPTVDSLDSEYVPSPSDFVFPVKSEHFAITNPYSMDSLIYSVTLDQYMTHCGMDIEAEEDAQVVAISDGTVTNIYEDDKYGTSIEITHGGGLISIYSNLSTTEMVEIGDVVNKGQIISGVGSSSLFESLESAHLHLEMKLDNDYVDPADYISIS